MEAGPIIELPRAECYSVEPVIFNRTRLGPTFRYRTSARLAQQGELVAFYVSQSALAT
jgi:hypothetical protein